MALSGILLDLDGTLVDSNGFHASCWRTALRAAGFDLPEDRIRLEIGKGGDLLVPALVGPESEQRQGQAIRDAYQACFYERIEQTSLRVFDGALDLIDALHQRGLAVALATSSDEKQVRAIEKAAGVEIRTRCDAFTTADDALHSKPYPDIVRAASAKLSMHPAQTALIGDTPYDVTAARHGGAVCIGLRCGGWDDTALAQAGARRVYADVADLLASLDDVLASASPASITLDQTRIDQMMRVALDTARQALEGGDAPIGAALFDGDGRLISRGYNRSNETDNPIDHAEIVAFQAAGPIGRRADEREARGAAPLILASSLEPCVMCTGAAMQADVDTLVYALRAPADSGTGRVMPPGSPQTSMPRIAPTSQSAADESRGLFEAYLRRYPDAPGTAFVRQLLSLTQ